MNKNRLITNTFLLIIFYFPIHATFSCLYLHYKLKQMPNDSENKQIDWEKLYPFTQKRDKTISYSFDLFEKLNRKFKSKTSKFEEKFNKYLPYKYKICEIQMLFEKLLGKYLFLEYDGMVILNNGYLKYWSKNKTYKNALTKTLNLCNFVKNIGSDLVFIICPRKNSKSDNQLPLGLKDINNVSCDEFLVALNNNNIKTFVLREAHQRYFKSQYDIFFKTDHHWKPSAGLWASSEICKYLNDKFYWEINTSLLNKDNFKITTLPNFFLGSQGKKITLSYTEPKDFELINPLYETSFQRICPEWKNVSGSFKEVIFCEKHIDKKDYYNLNPYDLYLNGNKSYLRLINNSEYAYNKKVLLIRDSFSCVVSPFLALCLKDLTMIDPRLFKGSIHTLIKIEKFDLVIIIYNTNSLISSKFFEFD